MTMMTGRKEGRKYAKSNNGKALLMYVSAGRIGKDQK